jgi:hypothetical protein
VRRTTGGACHTLLPSGSSRPGCFYRTITQELTLRHRGRRLQRPARRSRGRRAAPGCPRTDSGSSLRWAGGRVRAVAVPDARGRRRTGAAPAYRQWTAVVELGGQGRIRVEAVGVVAGHVEQVLPAELRARALVQFPGPGPVLGLGTGQG